MTKKGSFYDNLKGWPWQVFWKLNPVFMIIIIVLAIAVWAPDPLDIVTISFWGIVAGALLQKILATWIIIGLGILFWLITQIIESIVVIVITTYLIPAIVAFICLFFEADPLPVLFRAKSRKN
jgi:hypothetical protein